MAKKDLSDVIALMKLCGQWNDFTSSSILVKFVHNFRQVFQTVACIFSIAAICMAGFVNSLGNVMYFSMIGTLTIIQSLYFFYNHNKAVKIIRGFQETLKKHQYGWEDEIFHKQADFMWKIIKIYKISVLNFMIVYFVVPIAVDTIVVYRNPDSKGYRVPLPLEGFLDPIPKRDVKYYLATLIGMLWPLIAIPSSVGNQGLLCLFCAYLSAEFKILCKRLRQFGEEENARIKNYNGNIDIAIVESKLKGIIIDHQALMSISHDMVEYFGFPFAVQNTLISICNCLLLYAGLTIVRRQDIPLTLTNIFMVVATFCLAATTCSVGQMVETESLKVFETLYELPWYKQDPGLRKYINMMLRQAVRHMKIHFQGRSPLNLRTLMQILNTSYSYFMVLKSTV